MFAQPEYPPNGYPSYAPSAYHYSNPYINTVSPNGYPVPSEYTATSFGMPPSQHIHQQDLKLVTKDG